MFTYKIVIARYNEDIHWTGIFDDNTVLIYNKGERLDLVENQIMLENVGREGHTYFQYICDYYDNLPDYTVFLQGNPFDHIYDVFGTLINIKNHCNNGNLLPPFLMLGGRICTYHMDEDYIMLYPECTHICDTYRRVFAQEPDTTQEITFCAGAVFMVSKENIRKRPKSFYANIVDILGKEIDPKEGYDIERFHNLIFDI